MEPLNGPHLSSNLVQEPDVPSEDERDISPARKHHKAKQKRKASTISLRDNGKTKNRASKSRQSLSQTTPEVAAALTFLKTYDYKSSNDTNYLSTFDELETENNASSSDETTLYLTKLTLDEKDLTQRLQRNEASKSMETEYMGNSINLTVEDRLRWSRAAEQKNVPLENRLTNDKELAVTGIMNLSSMNVTDNDLPMIIQRAFWGGRNKCTGLILRDNSLTSDGVKMIVDALIAARTNLRYLSFSSNPDIGDAGVEHVIRLLQKNRTIVFLALPDTGMTDRGVRLLADILCSGSGNSSNGNGNGDSGNGNDNSEADADSSPPPPPPSSPPPLEKLYISFNKLITDESMEAILQILEQNHTLKLLSVEHCSLSDQARKRLRLIVSKTKKKKFSFSQ